jgi:hypothetical protein
MKRTLLLLSTLLALVAVTHADSIPLTSGSGNLTPNGFAFQFHSGGYNLSIPGSLDEKVEAWFNAHHHATRLPLA